MKTKAKRFISLCMALVFVLGVLPQGVLAAGSTPTISMDSVTAIPGDTVEMNVSIADNPGILGATLTVSFQEGLTLTKATAGEAFDALSMTKPGKFTSPCNFVWDGQSIEDSDIKDGVILTLTFAVSEDVASGTELAVNLSAGPFVDADLNSVTCTVNGGTVTVIDYVPGDLNGDQEVNVTDVILARRHIAGGYEQNINEAAADMSADGEINITDVILLRRFIAGGYPPPPPPRPQHKHTMEATAYKAPTCVEEGNIAYWYCTDCGNYYSDEAGTAKVDLANTVIAATGHTPQVIPAVEATYEAGGWTEGSECAVCKEVLVAPRPTDPLTATTHTITYDIANGDPYLEKLLSNGQITNPNPDQYNEESGLILKTGLSVPGYRFLGWYDLPSGSGAEIVKTIEAGTNYDVELYAHWEKITYTVQFKSDVFIEKSSDTYTVDMGVTLPTPSLSNYVFVGWTDEEGNLYNSKKIPEGTTGNITLQANWTSERNKTWTKPTLDAPIIYEDEENNLLLFTYEIGAIENVPLYTIKNFGYIAEGGITKTEKTTYATTISETMMEQYAKAVAQSTTESSNWTLSENWNESTSVDEEWCKEEGITKEEAETKGKSNTGTWNVSSSSSGSKEATELATNQNYWQSEVKVSSGSEETDRDKRAAGINAEIGASSAGISAKIGGTLDVESEKTTVESSGFESTGTESGTDITTKTATATTGWNKGSSYGSSSTSSSSQTTSTAISELISEKYGYGKTWMSGGESSETQGISTSQSSSDEYSSAVTYSKLTSEEVTSEWTTESTKAGYHRWIVAGTAHVFAVVGYDMSAQAFFVYTYSVLDDETHEFEDYSYTTDRFNDHQNGVISFEVPYEVAEYVADYTSYSEGLKVNQTTGEVTGYTGTDTCVVIPEYMNTGSGEVVKITGIDEGAFAGNTSITAVVLSDYITEIPDNAFKGCTALAGVIGGSITRIGNNAFNGCTSLVECGIAPKVEFLGEKAFEGVEKLLVNTVTADVIEAVVSSGAKNIVLYLKNMDSSALSGKTLQIPEGTESFVLNGYGKTFTGLAIVSEAEKTVINRATIIGTKDIPLQIQSPEVVLNEVTVQAPGLAMVLLAENTNVGLQGTISVTSDTPNTMLCKNINLYEINPVVDGTLVVSDKLFICGKVDGASYLRYGELVPIDAEIFENMLNSCVLYFDANGGAVSQTSVSVSYGQPYGTLPIPERNYYTFDGWYTAAEGGTKVDAGTVATGDATLYAHWINAWTDWGTSQPPSGYDGEATETRTLYRYRTKEYTTSTASSLSGWNQYDSTTSYGSWSSWSSWRAGSTSSSDTKDVQTGTVYGYYYYLCPNCGAHMHLYTYCYSWAGGCGKDTMSSSQPWHQLFSTTAWNGSDWHGTGKYYQYIDGELWFQWPEEGAQPGYRTRTRSKTTTYYYWKWSDWSNWSTTYKASSSDVEVQTQTEYRWKDAVD